MLSYANLTARVLQFLQDTGAATYDATETGYAIENEIKRLSRYAPVLIDVIFPVESRTGADTAGTASKLTDTTKSQFLSTDPTNEKVVHNIDDDTWAVITGYTSTSVLSISKDIMASGESYEIYNKRCRNEKQIYIGDMPFYLGIESVEYTIGTERYFKISRDIIELDVDDSIILDSDSTLTTLNQVDVLVKFALPQVLCQLTDLLGAVHTGASALATSMQVKSFTDAQVVEVGEMFNIAGHRTTYMVTTELTLANQATTGSSLSFYPGLEAAATADDVITFIKSTLQPNYEDLLERMVVSRAVQSNSINYINATNLGGPKTMQDYQQWINNNPLLSPVLLLRELEALAHPKSAKVLART